MTDTKEIDVEKGFREILAEIPIYESDVIADKMYEKAIGDFLTLHNKILKDRTGKIINWIDEQKKVDADEDRYTSIKNFIQTL